VPDVEPLGTMHPSPAQQSLLAVHAIPWGWHARGGPHVPFAQMLEQHWADAVHVAVFGLHMPASPPPSTSGGTQAPPLHDVPMQHSDVWVHIAPTGLQLCPSQLRPPSAPGTHGRPLQH
jgi:hypothetical protein